MQLQDRLKKEQDSWQALHDWVESGADPDKKPPKLEAASVRVTGVRKTWIIHAVQEEMRLCSVNHNLDSGAITVDRGKVTIVDVDL